MDSYQTFSDVERFDNQVGNKVNLFKIQNIMLEGLILLSVLMIARC